MKYIPLKVSFCFVFLLTCIKVQEAFVVTPVSMLVMLLASLLALESL